MDPPVETPHCRHRRRRRRVATAVVCVTVIVRAAAAIYVAIVVPVFIVSPSPDGAPRHSRYGAWSMIGLQFWEEQLWEGFVCGISFWFFLCPSSCSSSSCSSRIECFRTSSFFGWCIYGARGRGCC
ncbi:hypothetical protein Taro_038528 [Colocasia esculenta]|uniref:Uncharacterized protein n=1 Tax=Colocasia esculenta TaxID=4460 RepID=A0A843W3Q7_COLES|nr:hypothetical protein [Colocasia esculenta]